MLSYVIHFRLSLMNVPSLRTNIFSFEIFVQGRWTCTVVLSGAFRPFPLQPLNSLVGRKVDSMNTGRNVNKLKVVII